MSSRVVVEPAHVVVTGAAGQIAYSLVFLVADGQMLGSRPIILHLLDIPGTEDKLRGVVMELEDLASPVLVGAHAFTDADRAFEGADFALLVGARPRGPGMERKDLLASNAKIFRVHGAALDKFASKDVKVLVVGNPANTNALIALKAAPSIPPENFTCLTRLDQNRAVAQVAKKLHVSPGAVSGVVIWGNHSATQYPDVRFAVVTRGAEIVGVDRLVGDGGTWSREELIPTVRHRGARVIEARGASSAASAARSICDHMRDWVLGSGGRIVSMGVYSRGNPFGVDGDLVFSFPCVTEPGGKYRVVELAVDEFSASQLTANELELKGERELAFA